MVRIEKKEKQLKQQVEKKKKSQSDKQKNEGKKKRSEYRLITIIDNYCDCQS